MEVPADQGEATEMLMADWTGQFTQERVADLQRQAEHQRLARLAKAQRRGGTGGVQLTPLDHGQVE